MPVTLVLMLTCSPSGREEPPALEGMTHRRLRERHLGANLAGCHLMAALDDARDVALVASHQASEIGVRCLLTATPPIRSAA